jgi:tetratricopeptide (TPR) repeat protein
MEYELEALQRAAVLREAGWEASTRGMSGEMRDAFSAAVQACESIPTPRSTAAKRALANSLRGRAVALERSSPAAASRDVAQALELLAQPDLAAAPGIQRLQQMCMTLQGSLSLSVCPSTALRHYELALAIAEADERSEIDAAPSGHLLIQGSGKLSVPVALCNVAQAELRLGRFEQAEAHFSQVIADPRCELETSANAHHAMGNFAKIRLEWIQAAGHWQEGLRIARVAGNVLLEASFLAILGRYRQVAPELQDQPSVPAELADALRRLGRPFDGNCGICMEDTVQLGEGVFVLQDCLHAYHRACVEQFWRSRDLAGLFDVCCPKCNQ